MCLCKYPIMFAAHLKKIGYSIFQHTFYCIWSSCPNEYHVLGGLSNRKLISPDSADWEKWLKMATDSAPWWSLPL